MDFTTWQGHLIRIGLTYQSKIGEDVFLSIGIHAGVLVKTNIFVLFWQKMDQTPKDHISRQYLRSSNKPLV